MPDSRSAIERRPRRHPERAEGSRRPRCHPEPVEGSRRPRESGKNEIPRRARDDTLGSAEKFRGCGQTPVAAWTRQPAMPKQALLRRLFGIDSAFIRHLFGVSSIALRRVRTRAFGRSGVYSLPPPSLGARPPRPVCTCEDGRGRRRNPVSAWEWEIRRRINAESIPNKHRKNRRGRVAKLPTGDEDGLGSSPHGHASHFRAAHTGDRIKRTSGTNPAGAAADRHNRRPRRGRPSYSSVTTGRISGRLLLRR